MTPSQLKATIRLTTRITKYAKRGCQERWSNGPVVFTQEVLKCGSVMMFATNNTDEQQFFHTHITILIIIGKRGGLCFQTCMGPITEYSLK